LAVGKYIIDTEKIGNGLGWGEEEGGGVEEGVVGVMEFGFSKWLHKTSFNHL